MGNLEVYESKKEYFSTEEPKRDILLPRRSKQRNLRSFDFRANKVVLERKLYL